MRVKPLVIHSTDEKYLQRLHGEYTYYVGMVTKLTHNKLTVYPRSMDSQKNRRAA